MAVRRILTIGNSKLRQYAKPLTKEEINAPVTRQIVRDMAATLKEKKGWGISAPQIGVQKQIIIFDIPHLDSAFDGWPFSVIYNPKIEILLSEETNLIWEECHSVPGLVGLVPRHHTCALFWTDEQYRERRAMLTGTHAAIVQHEMDHLIGKLFPERMKDMQHLYFLDEWKEFGIKSDLACLGGDVRFPR